MSGFGERLTQRQKAFKKGVDADEARRKREDVAVQIRKHTKDEALQKRRMLDDGAGAAMADTAPGGFGEQLPQLGQMLMSEDPQAQLMAANSFRKLLSLEDGPPIQEVIAAGFVPRFVHFLRDVRRPDLQFEATWVLTNIASGTPDQTRAVVDSGALPLLVALLTSSSEEVREQAVWALGNIAGDSPNFRDLVLQCGGLNPLLTVLRESERTSVMRNATWALSNLCRGKPPPPFEWVSTALGTLANLIYSADAEVLTDACWALSYLTEGCEDRITAVIHAGVCRRLVELLGHDTPLVQTPALRTVGNIVTGSAHQTQVIVQSQALPALLNLLDNPKKNLRKESCWAISNVAAGTREQIQEIISAGIIPHMVRLLQTADFDIKKEVIWVLANATSGGTPQQIEYLVECGCIKPISDVLTVQDAKVVGVALDALHNILKVGRARQLEQGAAENAFAPLLEQADGLSRLERLQDSTNVDVYQKALKIIESFFPLEADGDDIADDGGAAVAGFTAQVPQGGFTFG